MMKKLMAIISWVLIFIVSGVEALSMQGLGLFFAVLSLVIALGMDDNVSEKI